MFGTKLFSIFMGKNVFEIFKKTMNSNKNKKKKDNFWTLYLKTSVNMVILKVVLPHPQRDIKFENP